METIAKYTILFFGAFIIFIGFVMLISPKKARETLRKAGSTNFINYAEITLRMLPAIAMIIYSDQSKYSEVFKIIGWFMLATSGVLFVIPRKLHHRFSMKGADILTPLYFRLVSPFAFLFGAALIYSVL